MKVLLLPSREVLFESLLLQLLVGQGPILQNLFRPNRTAVKLRLVLMNYFKLK